MQTPYSTRGRDTRCCVVQLAHVTLGNFAHATLAFLTPFHARIWGDEQTRAESFQRRSKTGSRGGGGAPGLSGSVWDSYSSMDLKIHEDVQGNVFVKASRAFLTLLPHICTRSL